MTNDRLFVQGTWAFLSALSTYYPLKPYALSDEIESFIHVLTWLLRYFPVDPEIPLPLVLQSFFEGPGQIELGLPDGHKINASSRAKITWMRRGAPPFEVHRLPSPAFGRLVLTLFQLCKEHYDDLDLDGPAGMARYRPQPKPLDPDLPHTSQPQGEPRVWSTEYTVPHYPHSPGPPTPPPTPPFQVGRQPLKDHSAVMSVFQHAVRHSGEWISGDNKDHEDAFEYSGMEYDLELKPQRSSTTPRLRKRRKTLTVSASSPMLHVKIDLYCLRFIRSGCNLYGD
ncbi:hypothetical protein AX16_007459 [Volvariella volvacea WC 439]|nr:hypothetical protein AX16_007459 [Volvariella volvacea WC 439]